MERKTKRMVALEGDIASLENAIKDTSDTITRISEFKPMTDKAKASQSAEMDELDNKRSGYRDDMSMKRQELELATIQMLAGKDTDFAEPTPADALRDAS